MERPLALTSRHPSAHCRTTAADRLVGAGAHLALVIALDDPIARARVVESAGRLDYSERVDVPGSLRATSATTIVRAVLGAIRAQVADVSGLEGCLTRLVHHEQLTSMRVWPVGVDQGAGACAVVVAGMRGGRVLPPHIAEVVTASTGEAMHQLTARPQSSGRTSELEQALNMIANVSRGDIACAGADSICHELARVLATAVTVVHGVSAATVWVYDPNTDDDKPRAVGRSSSRTVLVSTIGSGEAWLGEIRLADSPSTAVQIVVDHVATMLATELLRNRVDEQTRRQRSGELLDELVASGDAIDDDLAVRAERMGIDPFAQWCVALVETCGPDQFATLTDVARDRWHRESEQSRALWSARQGMLLVAMAVDVDSAADAVQALMRKASHASVDVRAGLSSVRSNIVVALREARAALNVARLDTAASKLVRHDGFGPLRFLLDAPDTTESAQVVTDRLGVLASHDAGGRSALMPTLRAYLDAGGHHATTAKACSIHVSTLKYRLARINDLIGQSLATPRTRFELSLAFEVLDVLRSAGRDPFVATVADTGGARPSHGGVGAPAATADDPLPPHRRTGTRAATTRFSELLSVGATGTSRR